jgi:molybdopterin converting factor small subunit
MGIQVRIGAQLLQHTGGEALIQLKGSTVRAVIDHLIARHPVMQHCLFHPDFPNQVRPVMHLYLNGKELRDAKDLATPVKDGDQLTIVPDVA